MDRKARYFLFISSLAVAAFLVVALGAASRQDWPFAEGTTFRNVNNPSGPFGSLLAYFSFWIFGRVFAWIVPVLILGIGGGIVTGRTVPVSRTLLKTLVIIVLLSSFLALIPATEGSTTLTGAVGSGTARIVSAVLGQIGGSILLITCLLLILLNEVRFFGNAGVSAAKSLSRWRPPVGRIQSTVSGRIARTLDGIRARRAAREAERSDREAYSEPDRPPERPVKPTPPAVTPWMGSEFNGPTDGAEAPPPRKKAIGAARTRKPVEAASSGIPLEEAELPPISILQSAERAGTAYSSDQLRQWSDVLVDKLSNYGVEGRVTAVNQGPMVTTFEFEPAPGVKIKDIVSRSDDLALAMRARSLRLIAPIPGRAVVGIEIPNPDQQMVYLGSVLQEIPERLRIGGIMIALGVDAIGKAFNMNLCSAPHLLMAGTTGSGKSVALNGFLASILFQYRPADVRLLLIDPKMVEMSIYNGIPHLLHPVITDPKEAVRIFNFLIGEMERRNKLLQKNGVKNIESYNTKIAMGRVDPEEPNERLSYIVLVVDELGDLVLTKGTDFEGLFSRLSNMARAVGIHMIVATQRPSVDVIVGKTKANFPTRIAFRVASKVDSRTILDCVGAEKLLGKGDMLYVDAKHPEALRLHGAWLSEDELEQLVNHWKQYEFEEPNLDVETDAVALEADGERDAFFDEAKGIILHYKQGSTSLLQRRLHVGYARAARLLDQLELAGVVGPPDGSKPREVLISDEEIDRALGDRRSGGYGSK